jgi:D-serine deaminase-like pyridoxal phosphate-dependent protein
VTSSNESLVAAARESTGLATLYRALDELVDLYSLDDAAVVLDVPGFGRQVMRAGRRPLRRDEQGLHAAEPGLYLEPPLDDPVLSRLMLALGTLALRHDAGAATPT